MTTNKHNYATHSVTLQLQLNSEEYCAVAGRFAQTMPNCRLREVLRIQNLELWDRFQEYVNVTLLSSVAVINYHCLRSLQSCKKVMLRRRKMAPPARRVDNFSLTHELNELLLFHGTCADVIKPIYTQSGFDWRLSGVFQKT